jgi:hypothetical protein
MVDYLNLTYRIPAKPINEKVAPKSSTEIGIACTGPSNISPNIKVIPDTADEKNNFITELPSRRYIFSI